MCAYEKGKWEPNTNFELRHVHQEYHIEIIAEIRVFFNPRDSKNFRNHERSIEQILPHNPQNK